MNKAKKILEEYATDPKFQHKTNTSKLPETKDLNTILAALTQTATALCNIVRDSRYIRWDKYLDKQDEASKRETEDPIQRTLKQTALAAVLVDVQKRLRLSGAARH